MYGALAMTSLMMQLHNEWWWTIWFATVMKYMFHKANNFWILSKNLGLVTIFHLLKFLKNESNSYQET